LFGKILLTVFKKKEKHTHTHTLFIFYSHNNKFFFIPNLKPSLKKEINAPANLTGN